MLINSAKKKSIEIDVLGLNQPWLGFGQKLLLVEEYLQKIPDDHIVLYVDAFDVLILENKESLLRRFFAKRAPFVVAVETGCFPDPSKAAEYPPILTPFRYINSGCYMGYAGFLKILFRALDPKVADNDQLLFTNYYLKHRHLFCLDYHCDLFLCLYGIKNSELVIDQKRRTVRHAALRKNSPIIHGNGGRKAQLQKIGRKFGFGE